MTKQEALWNVAFTFRDVASCKVKFEIYKSFDYLLPLYALTKQILLQILLLLIPLTPSHIKHNLFARHWKSSFTEQTLKAARLLRCVRNIN